MRCARKPANPGEPEVKTEQFETLPVSRQLQLLQKLGQSALRYWGLAGAGLELLKHRENTVMKVTAPSGGAYAMRIHRLAYRSDTELRSELQWLDSLRAAGIETTETVHALDGSLFVTARTPDLPEGRQCDLLAWVPGTAVGSVEEGVALGEDTLKTVYRSAGELAARIHNHGQTWRQPPGFARLSWDEAGFFGKSGSVCGRYWDLAELTPEQLALLHQARDVTAKALADFGKSADRYGLVHGDLLPENLFYDGKELRLIDWDDTGFSWHIYDFATAMFAHLGRPGFDRALAAMVEGYRRHRALPQEHLEMLPILIMARALSYVGWAHTRRATAGDMTPLIVGVACELAQQLLQGHPGQ
jgi:Ser/Thr protein kinase RdoA (MazF antagonist)